MSKRKKKNAVTLILLLLALAGLIGFYYWYTNRELVSEKATEATTIALSTLKTENIEALHYIYEDADLTLNKEGEVWVSEQDRSRPINQNRVESIIRVIDDISAIRIIAEKADNLEDYGLEDPISYLQAALSDGTKITLQIGNEAVTGEGYYALVNEDGKVYLLAQSYGSGLRFTDEDMTEVAKDRMIEAANIRHIVVDNRDSEDFELLYDENNGLDNSGSSMFPWVIKQPYTQRYTADSAAVTTLMEKYTTFDFIKCVEYQSIDLSKYGLDRPIAVIELEYVEPQTKKLIISIGDLDENNNYYVMIDGDSAVYTIDKDAIDNMLEVDVFGLLNKFVAIPNIDMVDKIDVVIGKTTYTMNLERSTEINDSGEEEVKTTYFYNHNEVAEDRFKDIYQKMISAKYDAPIKEEIKTEGSEPYLTITFQLNDAKGTLLTASYLPHNESFYIIKNGDTRFFADKRKIDDIVEAFIDFKATEE